MMLLMLRGFTLSAIWVIMRVDTKSVDGVLHGTETLEQNHVPVRSRTESAGSLQLICRGKVNNDFGCERQTSPHTVVHKQHDDDEDDLSLAYLAVAAVTPVSFALHTEPEESGNVEHREQSDCPESEAAPAMPPWKYLWRNKTQNTLMSKLMMSQTASDARKGKINAYGLLFLHHSSIPSWEDRRPANSCRTQSLAGAWREREPRRWHSGSCSVPAQLKDFRSDLLQVKDAEERLSRAQAATLSPPQEQEQAGQRLELQRH